MQSLYFGLQILPSSYCLIFRLGNAERVHTAEPGDPHESLVLLFMFDVAAVCFINIYFVLNWQATMSRLRSVIGAVGVAEFISICNFERRRDRQCNMRQS